MNTQLGDTLKNNNDTIDVSTIKSNSKSSITYVDSSCKVINNKFQHYETILGADVNSSDVNTQLDNYKVLKL